MGLDEGVLNGVLGLVCVFQPPPRVGERQWPMTSHDPLERMAIAVLCRSNVGICVHRPLDPFRSPKVTRRRPSSVPAPPVPIPFSRGLHPDIAHCVIHDRGSRSRLTGVPCSHCYGGVPKAILTCALNGVLTNPREHPVPVTPEEMAASARDAFSAGASIMHVHFRRQEPSAGHLPSWDPAVARACCDAIRGACPGVIINQTTGTLGRDVSGPVACLHGVRPEIAACNAGSLNYLKLRRDGSWAWPPMLFDNQVDKIEEMLQGMRDVGALPEFECFDVGIVRSVELYLRAGLTASAHYNFVMGVASGMPVDPDLLELLLRYAVEGAPWQCTLIGRQEIWTTHQRAAELGGMLRTGLEDTFYLPNGDHTSGNGPLIQALAECARRSGRAVASPDEARQMLGIAAT